MAVAVASVAVPQQLDRLARWGWPLAGVAYLGASLALEDAPARRAITDPQYLAHHQLYGLVGAGLVVAAVAGTGRGPSRWLTWRPLALIGLASYGLYLWNFGAMAWLVRQGVVPHGTAGHAAWFVLALALSLALAAASWRLVERPALGLVRRRSATARRVGP
jgi:peptidoglycan/LPS O-acetylase OafA/YrhL